MLYANATPEQTLALFPADFHTSLQGLITKVLQFHKDEWRAESLAGGSVSSMPQLQSTSWQVYRKPTPGEHIGHPAMLLSVQMSDAPGAAPAAASTATGGAASAAGGRTVHVEMTKEQLSSMLDGLGKIKEQLAMVTD